MKILAFSVVEILPALLDKTKDQTIRPAWKKFDVGDAKLHHSPISAEEYHYETKTSKETKFPTSISGRMINRLTSGVGRFPENIGKPPRFKVGEEVKLMWNQRSKYQWFCRECGGGIDGYVTTFEGVNVFRHNGLHECIMKNQVNDFLDLVFSDNSVFNKLLGTAKITEVFKIKIFKKKETGIAEADYEIYWMDKKIKCNWPWGDIEELAKRDGFKSAEDMFSHFDKNYDLSIPKEFWVYRWRRLQ